MQTATQYPCPIGTFSSSASLQSASQCTNCTSGYYCDTAGRTQPTAPCAAGFYCLGGAKVSSPTEGFSSGYVCSLDGSQAAASMSPPLTGDLCPPGHYGPQGSSNPQPCPAGTYSASYGNPSNASCLPCTAGESWV